MSGCNNGVQENFCQEVPHALYIHCYAHILNLSGGGLKGKTMEGEGGPKRSYAQEAKIKRNKKRALIQQKPKCKKTKADKTGQKAK